MQRFRRYLSNSFQSGDGFTYWIDSGKLEQLGGVDLIRCGCALYEPSDGWGETKAAALRAIAAEITGRIATLQRQVEKLVSEAHELEARGGPGGDMANPATSAGER